MEHPLFCPRCKANRTRFNKIEQVAHPIKIDSFTGSVVENYENQTVNDPFHQPYKGSDFLIQCANCGNIDEEITFQKMAEVHPPGSKM